MFFILIGIAPQLVQNAIFAETAVFRLYLAEGDNIYFYILAAFVLAHVISFIFVLCPGLTVASTFFGHLIFMGNLILAIVLSFLWDSQSPNKFAGLTSTSLFLCALFAGICGNTSANVLYPFASKFHPILLTALSAGYGLSGVIVSTLVIAQQSDTTDLVFSVKTYFIVVISLASVCYFIYILMAHSNLADTLLAARTVRSQISVEEPSRTKICTSITSACFNMFICSMITFWLPSLFISLVPLSLNSDPRFFSYLNFLFLVINRQLDSCHFKILIFCFCFSQLHQILVIITIGSFFGDCHQVLLHFNCDSFTNRFVFVCSFANTISFHSFSFLVDDVSYFFRFFIGRVQYDDDLPWNKKRLRIKFCANR